MGVKHRLQVATGISGSLTSSTSGTGTGGSQTPSTSGTGISGSQTSSTSGTGIGHSVQVERYWVSQTSFTSESRVGVRIFDRLYTIYI